MDKLFELLLEYPAVLVASLVVGFSFGLAAWVPALGSRIGFVRTVFAGSGLICGGVVCSAYVFGDRVSLVSSLPGLLASGTYVSYFIIGYAATRASRAHFRKLIWTAHLVPLSVVIVTSGMDRLIPIAGAVSTFIAFSGCWYRLWSRGPNQSLQRT